MRFGPGQSGNPGGRPRSDDIAALARSFGRLALARLVRGVASGDERVAIASAIALLERGYGRPVTPVADNSDDFARMVQGFGEASAPMLDAVTGEAVEVEQMSLPMAMDELDRLRAAVLDAQRRKLGGANPGA